VAIAPVVPLTRDNTPLAKTLPAPGAVHHADLGAAARTNNNAAAPVTKPTPAPVVQIPASAESAQPENYTQTPTTTKEYKTYVVASPQTVNHLAASFGVDPQELIELNKLKNYNLKEGQKVKIPVSSSTTTVAKKAEPVSKPAEPAAAPVVAKAEPKKVQHRETSSMQGASKPAPVVAKVEPKPEPTPAPVVTKVEPKPEPKPEPVVAKVEPKPEPKPVVAKVEPKPAPQPAKVSALPAVAAAPAPKAEPKKLPEVKQESAKAEPVELDNDSMMLTILKKQRRKEALTDKDSDYLHPKGMAYKVFDYKETNYHYDLYSELLAEENAIDVNTVNQRKGKGNKHTTHVVTKYETLQSIAKKYKISATDIINWNGLMSYRVREGQELTINSVRADMSPYERTIPDAQVKNAHQVKEKKIVGYAIYDAKMVQKRGVYIDGIEKGKFVYIVSRDNYREHFARVLGPLPKGTPQGVVVVLDAATGRELKVEKSTVNVEVYFGLFEQGTASNE
jgi:LysM repeat protein